MLKLVALHKHWLAADAVKQFVLVEVPVTDEVTALPSELLDLAQAFSASLRLCVFYALLYVVVEGYKDLDCHDAAVDALLAQSDYVDALRRFRNATFHFQEDPLSPKLLEFLEAKNSEQWIRKLYVALRRFFENNLPIQETLKRYRGGG